MDYKVDIKENEQLDIEPTIVEVPVKTKPKRKAVFTYFLAPIGMVSTILFSTIFVILGLIPFVIVVGSVGAVILWLFMFVLLTVATIFLIWLSPEFWEIWGPNGGSYFDAVGRIFEVLEKAMPFIIIFMVITFILTIVSIILTWIFLILGKANNKKSP